MNWLILADQAAAPTDWVSILLSAGVAGAVLVYLFVKFIPDMKADHTKERTQLRSDNEKQETKQRADFKESLGNVVTDSQQSRTAFMEGLAAERASRESFQEKIVENTSQHTIVLTELKEALRENTGAVGRLTKSRETGVHPAARPIAIVTDKPG